MEWKKFVSEGMDAVKAASRRAAESAKDPEFIERIRRNGTDMVNTVVDKVKDEEFRKDTAQRAADVFMEISEAVADMAVSGTQKTVEYVEKNRVMPGAKEKYIRELEQQLEKKEKEIRMLKRRAARKNWTSRK